MGTVGKSLAHVLRSDSLVRQAHEAAILGVATMSDNRQPTSVVLPAVVALVLLGAYVGAYYSLTRPAAFIHDFPEEFQKPLRPKTQFGRRDWLNVAFRPMWWVDRRIRPNA